MTVDVTKLTGAAVLKPRDDEIMVAKVTAYAVLKPAAPSGGFQGAAIIILG